MVTCGHYHAFSVSRIRPEWTLNQHRGTMFVLQWQCQSCRHQTPAVPAPFDAPGQVPPADLYCIMCGEMTEHAARMRAAGSTVGHALAAAAAEEQMERTFLSVAFD
jgi:hypothetical protein